MHPPVEATAVAASAPAGSPEAPPRSAGPLSFAPPPSPAGPTTAPQPDPAHSPAEPTTAPPFYPASAAPAEPVLDEPAEEEEDFDEYAKPAMPEPPRRVPFGIAVTTALLGVVTVMLVALTLAALTSFHFNDDLGRSFLGGLLMTVLAVGSGVTGAVAWSFVRNGNQIGALVVGGIVALLGLINLASGMMSAFLVSDNLAYGMVGVLVGMVIGLLPLLGDGPGYLAARRVWAKAERDWLNDITTDHTPPVAAQQWPGQPWLGQQQPWPAPQQQPWPAPQQGWPAPQQQPWGQPAQQPWGQPTPQPWAQPGQAQQPPPPAGQQAWAPPGQPGWAPPPGQQGWAPPPWTGPNP